MFIGRRTHQIYAQKGSHRNSEKIAINRQKMAKAHLRALDGPKANNSALKIDQMCYIMEFLTE